MLESVTFNHEMSSFQTKPVQCSLAMVGFSSDKINILQHIKCLFSAIVLAPGALDGMNTVSNLYGYVSEAAERLVVYQLAEHMFACPTG